MATSHFVAYVIRAAKLWSEVRLRFWMWECRSHRRWRAEQHGVWGGGLWAPQRGKGWSPGAKNVLVKWRKNIWSPVDDQVARPANVFRSGYKLLTDDFPMVQAFWSNILIMSASRLCFNMLNRRLPRSMRSQGKRRGCGSRQACRPRWRFRRIVVSRGNVDASLFHIKIRFFMGHQDQHGQNWGNISQFAM